MSTKAAPTQPQVSASLARREAFYAAYGSDLSAERFACYIEGGTAPGASRALPGARDRRRPESWHALRLPGRLSFRGHSSTWGGAPAIFEPATPKEHAGTEVFARAWRLGWDQLEDVMAQENGRPTIPLVVEPAAVVDGFSLLVGPGRYDRLVCVGTLEGLPVLTFTRLRRSSQSLRRHRRSRTWSTSSPGCARPSDSSTPQSSITSGVRQARRPTSFVPLWLSEGAAP